MGQKSIYCGISSPSAYIRLSWKPLQSNKKQVNKWSEQVRQFLPVLGNINEPYTAIQCWKLHKDWIHTITGCNSLQLNAHHINRLNKSTSFRDETILQLQPFYVIIMKWYVILHYFLANIPLYNLWTTTATTATVLQPSGFCQGLSGWAGTRKVKSGR